MRCTRASTGRGKGARGQGGSVSLRGPGCNACAARGPQRAWEPWSWRCTPGSSLPPLPPQGRPKAAQRQSGHAAAPNTLGGTEGEPNGRNFRPPGVEFLEGSAVLHGPLLRGGCFARRSQATSCGACCRYTSQARALGAGPTGPMGERERESDSWYTLGSCAKGDIAWGERASGCTGGGTSAYTRLWGHSSACRVL